ncbi:MAG: hypothetical protein CMF59_14790 [Leptospiraceae bacterium]|nr:hypothetical protein [Leptospiraceae bacterium]
MLRRIITFVILAFASLLLPNCHGWHSQVWQDEDEPNIEILGLGHVKTLGLTSRFIDDSSLRRSILFMLRKRGLSAPRPLGDLPSGISQGFLDSSQLMSLNATFPGRYWLRGEMDIRPEETLIQRKYSLSLSLEIVDLATGRIQAQGSVHRTELETIRRSHILEGLRILLGGLLVREEGTLSAFGI